MKQSHRLYSIKKAKPMKDGERPILKEVGTLLIRDGGKTGVLWLDLLDGELAVFERDRKPGTAVGTATAAAGTGDDEEGPHDVG